MKSYPGHSEHVLPLIGIGVGAVVAFIYILWSPEAHTKRSGRRRKVAGLENLGNTCYLNTILQSLAACPAFLAWLNRALRRGCFKGKGNELAYKLSHALEGINDQSSSQIYSPREMLYALYNRNWRAGQEQQDAHELFQFLLSELSEDREQIPSPLPLGEAPKLVRHTSNGAVPLTGLRSSIKANLPRVTNRDVDSPFRGLLANHLSCTTCGHKNPVTYTSFDCLSLPIPSLGLFTTLSLDCILKKFTQPELVHDVECVECTRRCSVLPPLLDMGKGSEPQATRHRGEVDAVATTTPAPQGTRRARTCKRVFQKQMTIGKLPQCLCVHIQRVGWQPNGLPFRREEHIIFPEVLDMSRYRLASVIATCNNGGFGAPRVTCAAQDTQLATGPVAADKRHNQPSNHTFIGDSFLSPTRPASLRLVGGGWIARPGREGAQSWVEGEAEATASGMEDELAAGFQDSSFQTYIAKATESKYKLASAVVHVGNAFNGHFLTYRRGPSQVNEPLCKNWLCVSDESVYGATLSDVLTQKAYMLYYQRE